jgi:soluble lytic murein transglycosylase-like protein
MKHINKSVTIALILIGSLIGSLFPASVESSTDMIPYYMFNAATQFNIDVALLYAFCTVESRCRAKALNKNDGTKKARAAGIIEHSHGLFQIKLATARVLGFKGSVKELMKPEINTFYAAKLIRKLHNKHGDILKTISAYNAGRPIKSNKDYVEKVLIAYAHYKIDKKF